MLHSGTDTHGAVGYVHYGRLGAWMCLARTAEGRHFYPKGFLSKLPISFRQHVLRSGSCSPRLDTPAS